MGRLVDDVAVVTGGGGGIGEATCERFAEEGAAVVVVDWDGDAARETSRRLEAEFDTEVLALEADVSSESDVRRVADRCEDRFGTVDILVNNAGIRVDPSPVTEVDDDRLERILGVNLKGVVYCSKHLIPLMGGRDGDRNDTDTAGAIVNVASIGAGFARPGWSLYDATKGAIISMTRDMACDHADDNIRVNAISPGYVVTDHHIGDRTGDEAEAFIESETTPHEGGPGILDRAGKPAEIASSILYLVSEDASYVTGMNLEVDGGASVTGL